MPDTGAPRSGTSVVPLVTCSAALGFYVALFTVSVVMGDAAMNVAFPNPWRELLCVPGLAPPLAFLWIGKRGRRV